MGMITFYQATAKTPLGQMPFRHSLLLGVALCALSACTLGATNKVEGPAPSRSTKIVEHDIEAPQVFQVSEQALWDGRPSLGGVWVASPDTRDPERVIMRNPANGKFVIGALFKRERDNPGPKLQISSDAAESLGLLAGQPAQISVTALRREEAPLAAPATPVLDSNEDTVTAAANLTAAPITTAALPEAKAAGPLAPTAPRATTPPAAPNATSSPKAKTNALADGASAAIDQAEAKPLTRKERKALEKEKAAAQAKLTAAADAQPPAAAQPPIQTPAAPAPTGRPIQIGFFSIEANAERAKAQLAKSGITATIRKDSAQGKTYWSVFARGDNSALAKIRSAGFADAYLLK